MLSFVWEKLPETCFKVCQMGMYDTYHTHSNDLTRYNITLKTNLKKGVIFMYKQTLRKYRECGQSSSGKLSNRQSIQDGTRHSMLIWQTNESSSLCSSFSISHLFPPYGLFIPPLLNQWLWAWHPPKFWKDRRHRRDHFPLPKPQ